MVRTVLVWFPGMAMRRLFCILCFLVSTPLPPPLFSSTSPQAGDSGHRSGIGYIDLRLLLLLLLHMPVYWDRQVY
jgi:hypothetical protein